MGIIQGDNLKPTLFKIVMDDLPRSLSEGEWNPVQLNKSEITCLMFGDDMILLSETLKGLQNAINRTYGFIGNRLNFRE